jgi:site-specific recombinase XerD
MNQRDGDELPPFAVEYLASAPIPARRIVRCFHRWLKSTYRPVLQLEPPEVEGFLSSLSSRQERSRATRANDRRLALGYLGWLHEHRLLPFDPKCAWPRGTELPPHVVRFLQHLTPTHKLSTIRGYQTNLRQFHIWLDAHAVPLADLDRAHVSSWLQWMHARGLHAATRVTAIQEVRGYLRWLEDQPEYSGRPADELIRRGDVPKLPQYLPRPIPIDVDRELQRRLRKSRSVLQLGLLLMRRTGLRIGELRSLPYDCVRSDPHGNSVLKVPLGKLATERLVPLDARTAKLVAKLRRLAGRRRALLLETTPGKKTRYEDYRRALKSACRGFTVAEPITSHRLRHTYATAMLAGGMSFPAVMKILGHRDHRMTLRYAAITDHTVAIEYAEALRRSELRYETTPASTERSASPPIKALTDLARYIEKRVGDDVLDKPRARALIKRLRRLDTAVRRLFRGPSRCPARPNWPVT